MGALYLVGYRGKFETSHSLLQLPSWHSTVTVSFRFRTKFFVDRTMNFEDRSAGKIGMRTYRFGTDIAPGTSKCKPSNERVQHAGAVDQAIQRWNAADHSWSRLSL